MPNALRVREVVMKGIMEIENTIFLNQNRFMRPFLGKGEDGTATNANA